MEDRIETRAVGVQVAYLPLSDANKDEIQADLVGVQIAYLPDYRVGGGEDRRLAGQTQEAPTES